VKQSANLSLVEHNWILVQYEYKQLKGKAHFYLILITWLSKFRKYFTAFPSSCSCCTLRSENLRGMKGGIILFPVWSHTKFPTEKPNSNGDIIDSRNGDPYQPPQSNDLHTTNCTRNASPGENLSLLGFLQSFKSYRTRNFESPLSIFKLLPPLLKNGHIRLILGCITKPFVSKMDPLFLNIKELEWKATYFLNYLFF